MTSEPLSHTWDGLPVTTEKPVAVSVAVWRAAPGRREWLILHRRHRGATYEGEWAWTPPAGARLPGESVDDAVRRELREETGLALDLFATTCGGEDVAVFAAEAPPDAQVQLDAEHDRYLWVELAEARERCLPRVVGEQFACVAAALDAAARSSARRA